MKIYAVTGGAGFIGSHLVEALFAEEGARVRVIDNLDSGSLENLKAVVDRMEFVEGSVTDTDLLLKAFKGVEVVFHQAAIASMPRSFEDPIGTHDVNVTGTLKVLWAAAQCGVKRVVFASSAAVYGKAASPEQREQDELNPLSPYAIHKSTVEQYAEVLGKKVGLETVGLRYFNVFGARQDPSSPYSGVISKFIDGLKRGESLVVFGDGAQTRDFVYVKDVVGANLAAAKVPDAAGKVFNIGGGRATSIVELIETLKRVMGREAEIVFNPAREGDIRHSLACIDKARAQLGYEPKFDLEQGLRTMLG